MGRNGTVVEVVSRKDPRGDYVRIQWDGTISGRRFADRADRLGIGDRVIAVGEASPRRVLP